MFDRILLTRRKSHYALFIRLCFKCKMYFSILSFSRHTAVACFPLSQQNYKIMEQVGLGGILDIIIGKEAQMALFIALSKCVLKACCDGVSTTGLGWYSHSKKILSYTEVKSSPGQLLLLPLLFTMWCLVTRDPPSPLWSHMYHNSVALL